MEIVQEKRAWPLSESRGRKAGAVCGWSSVPTAVRQGPLSCRACGLGALTRGLGSGECDDGVALAQTPWRGREWRDRDGKQGVS